MKNSLQFTVCSLQLRRKSSAQFSNFPIFLILLIFFFHTLSSKAQSVSASLKADSSHILIGDHLNVKLSVKHQRQDKVLMPVVKDSLGNMEFISASKIDTLVEPSGEILYQTYTVSAFDSGEFFAGPLTVYYKNGGGGLDSILTNVIPVSVYTVPVDTTKPFKAIKAPLEVPYSWKEFIPYILGGIVLLILLAAAGFFIWKQMKKQKKETVARPIPKDPPHIWARKELKKLEEEKLWQKDEVKLYYSRLTDILRLYLEFRYKWLALESTTEEIESEIDNYITKEKAKENLLSILRHADLVKFAKMMTLPDANIKAMESAYKFIDFTEPKEQEEKK